MALYPYFSGTPRSYIDLKFLKDLPEYEHTKPYHFSGALPEEHESSRTNIQYEMQHHTPVYNLREEHHKLRLADHGFQLIQVPDDIVRLDVCRTQKEEYVESVTRLIKDLLGASFALCYDCRFRSSSSTKQTEHETVGTAARPDTPAEAAHIDLTPVGAMRRARRHLTTEEADKYLNEHWRMRVVNVWRPINIVKDWDLICCDFSTVRPDDLIAVDRVSSDYIGEVFMLKSRLHYRWYWMDYQMPNEATIFLSYDNHPSTGASYCPHTSAKNPIAAPDVPPRESVELRIMLFSPSHEVAD